MSAAAQEIISPAVNNTALDGDIKRVFDLQKAYALELRKSTAAERIAKLKKLRDAVIDRGRQPDYCTLELPC